MLIDGSHDVWRGPAAAFHRVLVWDVQREHNRGIQVAKVVESDLPVVGRADLLEVVRDIGRVMRHDVLGGMVSLADKVLQVRRQTVPTKKIAMRSMRSIRGYDFILHQSLTVLYGTPMASATSFIVVPRLSI